MEAHRQERPDNNAVHDDGAYLVQCFCLPDDNGDICGVAYKPYNVASGRERVVEDVKYREKQRIDQQEVGAGEEELYILAVFA